MPNILQDGPTQTREERYTNERKKTSEIIKNGLNIAANILD